MLFCVKTRRGRIYNKVPSVLVMGCPALINGDDGVLRYVCLRWYMDDKAEHIRGSIDRAMRRHRKKSKTVI